MEFLGSEVRGIFTIYRDDLFRAIRMNPVSN